VPKGEQLCFNCLDIIDQGRQFDAELILFHTSYVLLFFHISDTALSRVEKDILYLLNKNCIQ